MPPDRSECICNLKEAREYYRAKLVGAHHVSCHGKPVTIVFELEAVHLYSTQAPDSIPDGAEVVSQPARHGNFEVRIFSLRRARLMDQVLRAICLFTVSIPGRAGPGERRVLHGPRLPTGEYMRVVLRKGPKKAWTCLSAFPVDATAWREARNARTAKFPPE